jgi:hypothetical protein
MTFWQILFTCVACGGCCYIGHRTGFAKAEAKFATAMEAMTAALAAMTDAFKDEQ